FPVLVGLSAFYLMRGERQVAQEIAESLLAVAQTIDDPVVLLGAHNMVGLSLFYAGRFIDALAHFEQAWKFHDPERSPSRLRALLVAHTLAVSCAAHTALRLMVLGYEDRAAARMRDCPAYARSIDHPLSVAMAYNFAATLSQYRREPQVVQELEDVRLEYSR